MKAYCQTIKHLVSLPYFDSNVCILLQLVTLFSTLGINQRQFEEPGKIDQQQESFTFKLLSYLRKKMAPSKSNIVIHQYLAVLADLRDLAEMVATN